eukprot:g1448.t1
MTSISQLPHVNIVETFLERGSVLKLSHSPIFSDFKNKSPVCVKQFIQQPKSTQDNVGQICDNQNYERKTPQKEWQNIVPDKSMTATQSDIKAIQETAENHTKSIECSESHHESNMRPPAVTRRQDRQVSNQKTNENLSERRLRRSRRKPNEMRQPKETSKFKERTEKPQKQARGTNTEFVPFFTLDPRWPNFANTSIKKTKTPMNETISASLLQPASSSSVPKAHCKPVMKESYLANNNAQQFEKPLEYEPALMNIMKRDLLDIKDQISKTNTLVIDLEKQVKEALGANKPKDKGNQDTVTNKDFLQANPQSKICNETTANSKILYHSRQRMAPKELPKKKAIERIRESPHEEMKMTLLEDNEAISLSQLVHEKKENLKDLTLKRGMCAIELKYLTKMQKAKQQFLKEFKNQEHNTFHDENIVCKARKPNPMHRRKLDSKSKSKCLSSSKAKEIQQSNLIDLEPYKALSHEEETNLEDTSIQRNENETKTKIYQKNAEAELVLREDVAPKTPIDDNERLAVSQQRISVTTKDTSIKQTSPDSNNNNNVEDSSLPLLCQKDLQNRSLNSVKEKESADLEENNSGSKVTSDEDSMDSGNHLLRVSDLSLNSSLEAESDKSSSNHSQVEIKHPDITLLDQEITQEDLMEPAQPLMTRKDENQTQESIDGSSKPSSVVDETADISSISESRQEGSKTSQETISIFHGNFSDIEDVHEREHEVVETELLAVSNKHIANDLSKTDSVSIDPSQITPSLLTNVQDINSTPTGEKSCINNVDCSVTKESQTLNLEDTKIIRNNQDSPPAESQDSSNTCFKQSKNASELDLEVWNSNEPSGGLETKESSVDFNDVDLMDSKDKEFVSERAIIYEDTSSASSVVSETGIDLCSSPSSSSEPFIEVFSPQEQDSHVQQTLTEQSLELQQSFEKGEELKTTFPNEEEELHEMMQAHVEADEIGNLT